MIKGCIFDYDGVILYTEKYHFASYGVVSYLLGVNFPFEEYRNMKGIRRKAVITHIAKKCAYAVPEEKIDNLCETKGLVYEVLTRNLTKNDLIPGVETFIERLFERGVSLGIASSGKYTKSQIVELGMEHFFSVILDGNTPIASKPAPDSYLYVLEKLGMSPEEVLVFEDSPNGVKAAHAAGIKTVGIGRHLLGLADWIIDDFESISDIEELFN